VTTNRYYKGPAGDHYDGARFFAPGHPGTDRSLVDILRWRFTSKRSQWPAQVNVAPTVPQRTVGGCRATMVGHATVLLQVGGLNILTDPVWSERASPFSFAGPKRVAAPGINFDDLPAVDLVLLSHNHYDHLDIATLARLHARDRPRILTGLGNDVIIRRSISDARITVADWGEGMELEGGGQVVLVPAQHWSARGLGDRRMALWCGFMVHTPQALIYFAGDTGYGDGAIFRHMREEHGAPDLAIIPIGAYAPRWFMAAQHVNPEEAVRMLLDLDAKTAMGIHWGCFQLTDEARDEPAEHLRQAMAAQGLEESRFRPAVAGEVFEVRAAAAPAWVL
jgi:L-ascorbate metabolism protein UlaG (beta-lactamase superfamily)